MGSSYRESHEKKFKLVVLGLGNELYTLFGVKIDLLLFPTNNTSHLPRYLMSKFTYNRGLFFIDLQIHDSGSDSSFFAQITAANSSVRLPHSFNLDSHLGTRLPRPTDISS